MTAPVLQTERLTVGYGGGREIGPLRRGSETRAVLRGLDLRLERGEFVCLLGPNGSGKSTLIRTIAGIQRPLDGRLWLSGDEMGSLPAGDLARRLSVVLTERVEAGGLHAYDVVALGRYPHTSWSGRLNREDRAAVEQALRLARAEELAARPLAELSDGERQRVLVARALAQEPSLIVLDEPTAFLDVGARAEVVGLLRDLARREGIGVLVATHELDLALRNADSVWLLTAAGGVTVGAPEDLMLQGVLAAVFENDAIEYETSDHSFRPRLEPVGRAAVRGEGPPAELARAALQRAGYTASVAAERTSAAELLVEVRGEAEDLRWRVRRGANDVGEAASLGELARLARAAVK